MFKSLNDYYDYLKNDNGFDQKFGISSNLTSLRDSIEDIDEKKKCTFEIYFSDFNFKQGNYVPLFSNSESSYPSQSLFEDFEYIKYRAGLNDSISPKYLAKYNHLLWDSSHKHIDYAKKAIDYYFKFIKSALLPKDNNLSNRGFSEMFKNLFVLSQTINYKKDDSIKFLIDKLDTEDINGFQKYLLMDFITKNSKKLDKVYTNRFFAYSKEVIEKDLYTDLNKEYLQLLIDISKKLGKSQRDFHNKLGDCHIADSSKHKESFVVHDFYLKALKEYQKAGNKKKIEEVTVLIEKAKDNLNFKSIKTEHSSPELQKWYDALNEMTTNLVEKGESKDIYEYLMCSDKIFPKAKVLDEKINSVMMDLVSTMSFDINRNVSGNKGGINSYYIHIQNFTLRHLWLVFSKGLKNGKISFDSLKDFLKNNTWYGVEFSIKNPAGKTETYNWLQLLTPALDSYFKQSEIDIKTNTNSSSGYILSIDSLVLKFEGILREFSRYNGAQTIDIKENGTQERISFEKLLENEKFKELVPEDDIALFKFMFTSEGMNLRNNIAHCFFKSKDYSAAIMWLLICAFLKLGNYKLKTITK
ncbi:uncharacterized protein DUF4209 [Tenacibaculum skagerrakense]|uniref:Uncharacterized protein DUF4209 n=1 Tax=Tenacibaculum skagerrakense TaxID=186571 RepID=A0A4V2SL85_9FLAO|nr:DUF4209 domain-containing protein [Tenacibaculum skagerrakense]TCP22356.1 uncharacterized protein DUF4209 [Tenacibaculum skagerrakense]